MDFVGNEEFGCGPSLGSCGADEKGQPVQILTSIPCWLTFCSQILFLILKFIWTDLKSNVSP